MIPALIFLVTWGLTTHGKYSVTGDEPHYLLVAQSLRADGDLELSNNYANGDAALFGAAGLQPELHVRRTSGGRILPVHDIGVPVILTPVYASATRLAALPSDASIRRMRMNRGLFAYSLVSLFVLGISTAAAAISMRALQASGASRAIAASIALVAWLSAPLLSNAFLVFPEPFALFITACTVAVCTDRGRPWSGRDDAVVFMLGAMPWLHRKFAFYAVALFAVLLWQRKDAVLPLPPGRKAIVLLLFAGLPAMLAIWTLVTWGNLAGPLAIDRLPFSMAAFTQGIAGTIVDRENGLIWWAPVYALLPAAFWLGRRRWWPWLVPILALAIPNAAHDQWWGGFSPAARFLVPLVPVFCLFAMEIPRRRPLLLVAIALLVPQLIMTAYAWQHPRMLWPQGDGENRILAVLLPPLSPIYRALPSFRTAPHAPWTAALVIIVIVAGLNMALVLAARSDSRR